MSQEFSRASRHTFDSLLFARPRHRVLAFLVDSVFAMAIAFMFYGISGGNSALGGPRWIWILFYFPIYALWELVCLSTYGTSPGRKVFGLRVYSPKRDGIPDVVQVSARIIGFWTGFVILGLGLTPVLFRRDRRGWADSISETIVIGDSTDEASPLLLKFAQFLYMTQIAVLLGGSMAFSMSDRPRNWFTRATSSPDDLLTSGHCQEPQHLVRDTSETLFAIAISPAWSECWDKTHFGLERISDSQLFWIARLARSHFDLTTHANKSAMGAQISEINKLDFDICRVGGYEGCTSGIARDTASTDTNAHMASSLRYWLKDYSDTLDRLVKAPDQDTRLLILNDALDHYAHPIVKNALIERIWAETAYQPSRLSRGTVPPGGAYGFWYVKNLCWVSAMTNQEQTLCGEDTYSDAYSVVVGLESQALTQAEYDYYLSDFQEEKLPNDFTVALMLGTAVQQKNTARAQEILASLSELSPLYPWASRLASTAK